MKGELKRINTTLHQLAEGSFINGDRRGYSAENQVGELEGSPQNMKPERLPSFSMSVPPFPAQKYQSKIPVLPKLKAVSISSHRHAANPALAMTLLQEIEAIVGGWQQELQQGVRQIQDLYLEGPIIDGWLESASVEEIHTQSNQSPRAGYRLCGLDEDGQLWWRDCPSEQVASVSVALARYQKLRQLLNRKDYLETRLTQLAETLVVLQSYLQSET